MEEPGRLHDAALVRIRQPDRTGGAALPVAPGVTVPGWARVQLGCFWRKTIGARRGRSLRFHIEVGELFSERPL